MMSDHDTAHRLVSQMSMDEKIKFCSVENQRFGRLERLGLKGISFCDNPYGNEEFDYMTDEERAVHNLGTAVPAASAIAASWNEEFAHRAGKCIACDAKANGVDMLLRPGVNIKRSPLCGRNFEYFSEDPVLSGEMAGAYINGIQSMGIAANIKHFAANNQELDRMVTNSVISERALREVYLRSFEIAIKKSKPWTLMTSYNKINGDWSNSNRHLMCDILRGEWDYDGVILSDAMAVHTNKVEAHRNGMDVELCISDKHEKELCTAVTDGCFPLQMIDKSVERIIELELRIGNGKTEGFVSDRMSGHSFARQAAADAAVLLTNDGILPLDGKSAVKVAVIGALAETPSFMGAGSGRMNGHTVDIPFIEIKKIFGKEGKLSYSSGYHLPLHSPLPKDIPNKDLIREAMDCAIDADIAIIFIGLPYLTESEGFDRPDLSLPQSQINLLKEVWDINKNTVVVLNSGAPVDLEQIICRSRAIVQMGYSGEAMGGAAADVLFGLAEPGGRLPETYPIHLQDTPAYLNYSSLLEWSSDVLYGEDIFTGYRWYEAREIPVRFPFGHGLSYTSFEYGRLSMDTERISVEDILTVMVDVKNIGSREGAEVVQLYVRDLESSFRRPVKELKAFRKLYISPGDTQTATFILDRSAFEYYSPVVNEWIVEEGEFELLIGSSSFNIKKSIVFYVTSKQNPVTVNEMTPVQRIVNHPKFPEISGEISEKAADFMNREKNAGLDLAMCMPLYRLTEETFFEPIITEDEMQLIIDKLNHVT